LLVDTTYLPKVRFAPEAAVHNFTSPDISL
jgi:hypothetical protein